MGFVNLTLRNGSPVYVRADRVDKVIGIDRESEVAVQIPRKNGKSASIYQIHLAELGIDVADTSGCGACNR